MVLLLDMTIADMRDVLSSEIALRSRILLYLHQLVNSLKARQWR